MILDKPLEISNCQFKMLREASLFTSRPKEIHTRVPQELKGRTVYGIPKTSVKDTPAIKVQIAAVAKKYKTHYKLLNKSLGGSKKGKRISAKSVLKGKAGCNSPKIAQLVLKKPLKPKNLAKHIKSMNKKTIKAMRKGKLTTAMKQEIKQESSMNCDKI